ncbi:polysaccharide deacetylase family protein [Xanthomonas sp. 60]
MTTAEIEHRIPVHPWRWVPWLLASQLGVAALWLIAGWAWGLPAMVASHALFLVPVFLPNSRFYAPVLSRLEGSPDAVWLTIDDGPGPDTLAVLDLLDHYQARATFFVVGERAQAHPQLVQEILRRGHSLGNHSHTHPQTQFWRLGPVAMAAEIGRCQQALTAISGRSPSWYRSVVGMTNPFVAAALRRHGLTRVGWSARGYDGVHCTPQAALERLLPGLQAGAIVLVHEGAAHGHARVIIEGVLQALQARGLHARLPTARAASRPAEAPAETATP